MFADRLAIAAVRDHTYEFKAPGTGVLKLVEIVWWNIDGLTGRKWLPAVSRAQFT